MIGYKGFDKNFRCRGYQYEVGKTYHYNGELIICESGFHFCDTPLAVFEFYKPTESRFALVETSDNIVSNNKHKFCTDELKIIKELSLHDLIACAKNVTAKAGYRSVATNTGDYSVATVAGKLSVAVALGQSSHAKGDLGCWLVLSRIENERRILKAVEVDGNTILPDTFYTLDDEGQVVRYAND